MIEFIYHAKRNSSLLHNSVQSSWKTRFRRKARLTENRARKIHCGNFLISNKLMSLRIFANYRTMHWSWDVFHCKRQLKLTWIRLMLPTACFGSMNNLRLVNFVLFRRLHVEYRLLKTKRQDTITNSMVNARSVRGYNTAKPTAYKLCAKKGSDYIL